MSTHSQNPVGEICAINQDGLVDFASSFHGLRNLMEGLRGGMKFHHSFDVIRRIVDAMITAWCTECYYSYALPSNLIYVRARRLDDPNRFPEYADMLGAPKNPKEYGRCHIPYNPVLYCSLLEETTLSELDAQIGEVFTIATYKNREKQTILACHVGDIDYFRRTGGNTHLGCDNQDNAQHLKDLAEGEKWNGQCLLDAFLAEEFIERATSQSDYRVTSAFCHILWKEFGSQDGLAAIMYPSVEFRDGKNFAFDVHVANDKLELFPCETRVVKVDDVLGFGMYRWTEIARLHSVEQNSILKWKRV